MSEKIKIKQIWNADLQQVTSGNNETSLDLQIDSATAGFLLTSPDNFQWRITINNDGQLLAEQIIPTQILDVLSTTASFAWSMRQMNSDVDTCIKLRRSLDDKERVFYYENGEVDLDAILFWAQKTQLFIVTLYDSSGNGNDATELDPNQQEEFRPGNYGSNSSPITTNQVSGVYLNSIGSQNYNLTIPISNSQDIDAYVFRELHNSQSGSASQGAGYFGNAGNSIRGLIKVNSDISFGTTASAYYRRGTLTSGVPFPNPLQRSEDQVTLLNTRTNDSLNIVEFFQDNSSIGTISIGSATDNDVLFNVPESAWLFEIVRFDGILSEEERGYYINSLNNFFNASI